MKGLFRLIDKPPTGYISIRELVDFVNGNGADDARSEDAAAASAAAAEDEAGEADAAAEGDVAAGAAALDGSFEAEATWAEKKAAWAARRATLSVTPDSPHDDDPVTQVTQESRIRKLLISNLFSLLK